MKINSSHILAEKYSCPMHPEVISDKPGRCPKCGMELELNKNKEERMKNNERSNDEKTSVNSYKPLIIVIGLILLSSLAIAYPNFNIKIQRL